MCGIVGQVRAGGAPVDELMLARMCAAVEHRGPDARGHHLAPGVGLGIQRLRVIDLETGDQPMHNEDLTVSVVLNGEIYNYQELRERLHADGHQLTSQGDTEVIAHLYEQHGLDCVRHLHGMFAFALWDSRRRRLVLARDRVGKKPLYYAHRGDVLSFASELNALMQDPELPRDPDPAAFDVYLALRYIPAPLTVYRGVRKLPAATVLVFEEGTTRTNRYWSLDYGAKRTFGSREEVDEEIRASIRAATRRRMVADVPLGAFVSGGLDSSAVVAAMAESSTDPVRTFSIGFRTNDPAMNELPHARQVAQHFGSDHQEFVVEPDAVNMIPRIVRAYGEPFGDPTAIPSFYLAELASRHVTVALTGDGGDECFAGYQRYAANALLHRLDGLSRPVRDLLGRIGERLPRSGRINSPLSRARRLASGVAQEPPERYLSYMTHLDGLDRDLLYDPSFAETVGSSAVDTLVLGPWHESTATDIVDRMLDVDINVYLPGDLLMKMDHATMAYSLEARSPLLDHEFLQLAAMTPTSLKIAGFQTKVAIRSALRGWVPDEILSRPKQGFELPIADWFRSELKDFARDVLLDPTARQRGFFREAYVRDLLDRHAARQQDNASRIWTLLMFELWHQEFVDRAPATA